jgi:hypothetical protein
MRDANGFYIKDADGKMVPAVIEDREPRPGDRRDNWITERWQIDVTGWQMYRGEQERLYAALDEAFDVEREAAHALFGTTPTTLRGVIGLLAYSARKMVASPTSYSCASSAMVSPAA